MADPNFLTRAERELIIRALTLLIISADTQPDEWERAVRLRRHLRETIEHDTP